MKWIIYVLKCLSPLAVAVLLVACGAPVEPYVQPGSGGVSANGGAQPQAQGSPSTYHLSSSPGTAPSDAILQVSWSAQGGQAEECFGNCLDISDDNSTITLSKFGPGQRLVIDIYIPSHNTDAIYYASFSTELRLQADDGGTVSFAVDQSANMLGIVILDDQGNILKVSPGNLNTSGQ